MNISLNEVEDVIELSADEVVPTVTNDKYAQRNDVQVYQDELDMNGSLEV
ncbi:hypothetical protein [Bartonella krasnovii]|uniref:Uncharacterized protein n=1 Tax=Bartonella krasnovii TaxID=2267275 RepID=A0ABY3VTI7_9HYPH|nr:hypothetical protein [Bartonella krasnovii]UNF28651.1 hypothetical protein MNL13_05315 [Bartonella krasnovii]UNF35027.1 hypothetical protein MNL12_05315 [Bartonella krasnovii]UNF38435.1 hypothetical protein MNL10_06755 [Bartonella krasnovii]UNF40072.1 hypothetical protein MNL09_06260 [Bartonella krasnovii]UNF41822.1 hypothetical protein MNL08_06500 [Bartonella krasnovii]